MHSHEEIRDELIRQFAEKQIKQITVARALNIAPARVSEILARKRRVQPEEMAPLAELLGLVPALTVKPEKIAATVQIENLGKVAQGVWLEQTFADPDEPEYVSYDMRLGDPAPIDLFAVTPEGQSMNQVLAPGMRLICKRVPFGNGNYKNRDLVIVERQAHDLRELTCKRLIIGDDGVYWLQSESDQPQFQDPIRIGKPDESMHLDNEISVLGKVLRGVVDFEGG